MDVRRLDVHDAAAARRGRAAGLLDEERHRRGLVEQPELAVLVLGRVISDCFRRYDKLSDNRNSAWYFLVNFLFSKSGPSETEKQHFRVNFLANIMIFWPT